MTDDKCIFCKIANGEIPSATVYEHALILPKNHFADVCALDEKTAAKVLAIGAKVGAAMKEGLGCAGFNLVQNNGEAAGQTVMHFHMHVIPRYEGGPNIVSWTPGAVSGDDLTELAEKIKGSFRKQE